jgi:hypothetical protein
MSVGCLNDKLVHPMPALADRVIASHTLAGTLVSVPPKDRVTQPGQPGWVVVAGGSVRNQPADSERIPEDPEPVLRRNHQLRSRNCGREVST